MTTLEQAARELADACERRDSLEELYSEYLVVVDHEMLHGKAAVREMLDKHIDTPLLYSQALQRYQRALAAYRAAEQESSDDR